MKRAIIFMWLIAILYLFISCTPPPPEISDNEIEANSSDVSKDNTISDSEGTEEAKEKDIEEAVTIKGSLEGYKIKPGDILSIEGSDPEVKVPQARVDDKGFIKLKYIDRIKVLGLTKWEVEDLLEEKYKPYFTNLQIIIEIINLKYTIGGEIKAPGQKGIIGDIRLTEAIQVAGGYTTWANKKGVQIRRKNAEGKTIILKFNCEKIEKGDEEDPFIIPDDVITVPR